MSLQELESKQKLVLRSCGIQHPYLHLPWAAFEDSGSFCILYAVMDKVRCAPKVPACANMMYQGALLFFSEKITLWHLACLQYCCNE